jgi:hypothetical protein
VVVLANLVALASVARNRSGEPEAELWLTERELPRAPWTDESTGVFLRLEWARSWPGSKADWPWFDRAKLEALGFDCGLPADAKDAASHYARVVPREAYVVLELDGEAFGGWVEAREAQVETPPPPGGRGDDPRETASRLVPIDAGTDPAALRRLHPDRGRRLVVPAVVSPGWRDGSVFGRIRQLRLSQVHVPRDVAKGVPALRERGAAAPRYEVLVRFGRRLEPWAVEARPRP